MPTLPLEQHCPKGMKKCTLCHNNVDAHLFTKRKNRRFGSLCPKCTIIMDDVHGAFGDHIGIDDLRGPVQQGTLEEYLAAAHADTLTRCFFCRC